MSKILSYTVAQSRDLNGQAGPWKSYIDVPFTPEHVRICSIAVNIATSTTAVLGLKASFCGSSNTINGGIVAVFTGDAGTVYPNSTYPCNSMQSSAEFTVVDMLTGEPATTLVRIALLLEFTAREQSVLYPQISHLSNASAWPGNPTVSPEANTKMLDETISTLQHSDFSDMKTAMIT